MTSLSVNESAAFPDPARTAVPWLRWGCLVALLAGEVVGLSVRFDTNTLTDVSGEWAMAVAVTPRIIRLAILAIVIALVLRWRALVDGLRTGGMLIVANPSWVWLLVGHLACLSAFAWLTLKILEHGRAAGSFAPLWVLGWAASGALALASWGLTAMPLAIWSKLLRVAGSGLAVGFCVATAVWASELRADGLWQPLARGTLGCAGGLLRLFYADVVSNPTSLTIGTSSFAIRIDPDCSGYEGMALILAFLSGYLWFDRVTLRFPAALVLLPLGAVASWLCNVLRMTLLVAIGSSWSESIAMGGFHSQAGAIAFASIGLGFVVLARRSPWFARPSAARQAGVQAPVANPTAAYLVPFLAVIAVGMLTAAFSSGVDALYPLRVLAGVGALWYLRSEYRGLSWSCSGMSLLAGTAVFALWLLLAPEKESAGPAAAMASWPALWRAVWWTVRIGGYLLVAPVVEELAFRGFLMRRLMAAEFDRVSPQRCSWWAIGLSSLAFGALHGGFWAAGALAGLAYGYAFRRRGSLGDAVLAHAATNAFLFAAVLVTGNWSLLS
jgi:exosortase E/protease (VPEID-CTERM system)